MTAATAKRADLSSRAQFLREQGLVLRQIADELDISISYASDLIVDPTGEKTRARKRKYDGVCVDCGGRTVGDGGVPPKRCGECARLKTIADARWTKEAIVHAIREWNRVHGRPPSATDWNGGLHRNLSPERRAEARTSPVEHPTAGHVQFRFGSWNAALEAADLVRFPAAPFVALPDDEVARTVALYEQGLNHREIGLRIGRTAETVRYRLKKAGVYQPRRYERKTMPAPLGVHTLLDREIDRAQERKKRLVAQIEELQQTITQLEAAKAALDAPTTNGASAA